MTKEQKHKGIWISLFILFILIIMNVRFERYEYEHTKTVDIKGEYDFLDKGKGVKVTCNVPSRHCYYSFCENREGITWARENNRIGDWKSDYINFYGQGKCMITTTKQGLKLKILN